MTSSFAGTDTYIPVTNERMQFKFDSYNNLLTITKAGQNLWSTPKALTGTRTWTTCTTNLWIGSNWSGSSNAASMRLYNFKISEAGTVVRNYVPCVRGGQAGLYDLENNTFSALVGGKVSGAMLKGTAFQIAPQPAKLTHTTGENSATLTCLAAGAQSYEWYEDGVKIEGEAGDSLTLNWEKTKAKMRKHVYTYSVKPVYTVFNETVKGTAVTADVEFTPLGTNISIR